MKINKVSCLLLGTSLVINASLALVGPFFPDEALEKDIDINIIGYIFSAYPFSFVIISLIMPKILNRYSQRFMFIIGSITYALSVIGFGLLVLVDEDFFLVLAIVLRILQGASNSVVYTTAYSVFSMQYEGHDIMQINSYFKVTLGAGLVIGLLTGTLLYMIGGYWLPFITFGVFFLWSIPWVIGYFPSKIQTESQIQGQLLKNESGIQNQSARLIATWNNFNQEENMENFEGPRQSSIKSPIREELESGGRTHKYSFDHEKKETFELENSNSKSSQGEKNCNHFEIQHHSEERPQNLKKSIVTRIIVKCLILAILFLSLLNFAPAILAQRLEELDIHKYLYGLIFAIPWVVPVWSIFLVNMVINRLNGNSVLIIGAVLMSLGFFVVSVTSVPFFLVGISMLGFAAPFTILPLFPLMRNSLKKDDRNSSEAINVLSGLYNAALGIGAIVGPLIGSNLYYYFDFFTTAFVLGSSWILLAVVLFFSGGCSSNEAGIESSELSEHLGMINGSFIEPNILSIPSTSKLGRKNKYPI